MSNNRIKRIEEMERYLDETSVAICELSDAMSRYEEIEDRYYKLEGYYGSVKWMDDHEADEEGKLPSSLKRGVLSEDTVYDLITDHRDLMIRLQRAALKSMEAKEL